MIIQDHNSEEYKSRYESLDKGKHNGAYYYSKEIVEKIIPNITTDYNWQTIFHNEAPDHCIVFIHSNNNLQMYNNLLRYKDVILVCSTRNSQEVLLRKGHKKVIYVPLSVDTEYLDKFKNKSKKSGTIACGNTWAFTNNTKQMFIDNNIKHYHDIERDELLTKMSEAETVYAIGRTAMEAIYLGANVIQPDKEYPVEKYETYYTINDIITILQDELDKIEIEKIKEKSLYDDVKVVVSIINNGNINLNKTLASLDKQLIKPNKIYICNESNYLKPLEKETGNFYFFIGSDEVYYSRKYISESIKSIQEHKSIITYNGIYSISYHTSLMSIEEFKSNLFLNKDITYIPKDRYITKF